MTDTAVSHRSRPGHPIVAMTGISITFPGVKALDGVDFRLFPGEVHALMGENGAGKSTLIKALTGVYTIDSGSIVVDGEERTFAGPAQAQAAGISTVYQEVNLCDNLSVAENIMLGHEVRRAGVVDWRRTRSAAREHLRDHEPRHRPEVVAVVPLARRAAAGRDLAARWSSTPGCSSSTSRRPASTPTRSRTCSTSCAPCATGRRDPVRVPLPRPGVRDQRPHDGPAQRHARRGVPHRRPAPRRAGAEDDRPRARRARGARGGARSGPSPSEPTRSRSCRPSASGARARSSRSTSTCTPARSSGSRVCSAPAARSSRACSTAPTAPTRARSASRASRRSCAPRAPRWRAASSTPRRTARPRASSAT